MAGSVQKISIALILACMLVSCASSPRAEAPAYDTADEMAIAGRGFTSTTGESAQRSQNAIDDRMITYSVTLDLSVKDTDEARRLILDQMKHNNGFIVREAENYISTRIPSGNMDSFLESIRTLGKVENENKTGTDITDQYRDNVIRLESLRNVRNRYLTLLERANTVSDILTIERELERVNLEIERLEGRIQQAELSVAYSIITVRFGVKARPGPIGWIFYGLYHGIRWLFVWN